VAAIAAAEGSRVDDSWMVGEGFLGAPPRKSFLVENLRDKPLAIFSGLRSAGGVPSPSAGVGGSWDRSLTMRMTGRVSSRSFLFSSDMRSNWSRRYLSSISADKMRESRRRIDSMMRVMSSWVAVSVAFSPAAAHDC
jgi:hypothetical protein